MLFCCSGVECAASATSASMRVHNFVADEVPPAQRFLSIVALATAVASGAQDIHRQHRLYHDVDVRIGGNF